MEISLKSILGMRARVKPNANPIHRKMDGTTDPRVSKPSRFDIPTFNGASARYEDRTQRSNITVENSKKRDGRKNGYKTAQGSACEGGSAPRRDQPKDFKDFHLKVTA